jgi:hypothetical protein
MPSTKEAQVIAAGVSYFSEEKVVGPSGEVRKDQFNNDVQIVQRHEAYNGDIITISEYEFERLEALGAVREPSDAPLRSAIPMATPFGVPMVDPTTGHASAFQGPVMGDPRPAGPGVDSLELSRGRPGGLTPEQAAQLEAVARGEVDLNGEDVEVDDNGGATPFVESEQPGAPATRSDVEPLAHRPTGNGEGDGEALEGDYDDANVKTLKAEVARRGIEDSVEGTGENGRVLKDDLIAALEADDEEGDQS